MPGTFAARLAVILAMMFGSIACSVATPEPSKPADTDVSWGAPVNGLAVGLSVVESISEPEQGLRLMVWLRNVGNQMIVVPDPASRSAIWLGSPPVTVKRGGRWVYKHPPPADAPTADAAPLITLAPGQGRQASFPMLWSKWDLGDSQGPAMLQLRWVGGSVERPAKTAGEWMGEAESGNVMINFVSPTK